MGKERKHNNREVKKPKQVKPKTSDTPALLSDKGLRPMEQLPRKKK